MNQPIRILQLTDLHLFNDQQTELIGLNPYHSLQQVIALVTNSITTKQPSLIALTGDISQDYSLASYETAAKIFYDIPCPIIATMGNHEHPETFTRFFNDPTKDINKIVTLDNWLLLFLNSHYQKHVDGQLAKKELDFLQQNLTTTTKENVIIFLHHQVISIASTWLDKIKLNNALQLLEIIDQHPNVKAVICGHVHQATNVYRRGVSYLSAPATSWQFVLKSPDFKLDSLMPGYRWLDLYADGTFQTAVVRVAHNDLFIPDLKCKGY